MRSDFSFSVKSLVKLRFNASGKFVFSFCMMKLNGLIECNKLSKHNAGSLSSMGIGELFRSFTSISDLRYNTMKGFIELPIIRAHS